MNDKTQAQRPNILRDFRRVSPDVVRAACVTTALQVAGALKAGESL